MNAMIMPDKNGNNHDITISVLVSRPRIRLDPDTPQSIEYIAFKKSKIVSNKLGSTDCY